MQGFINVSEGVRKRKRKRMNKFIHFFIRFCQTENVVRFFVLWIPKENICFLVQNQLYFFVVIRLDFLVS